jgi:GNAT superfamily N-acetyltransferase
MMPMKQLTTRLTRLTEANIDIVWLGYHGITHAKLDDKTIAFYATDRHGLFIGFFSVKETKEGSKYLQWIEVDPRKRGKGYGRFLMEKALTYGPETLYVKEEDYAPYDEPKSKVAFFKHFGFEVTDEGRKGWYHMIRSDLLKKDSE